MGGRQGPGALGIVAAGPAQGGLLLLARSECEFFLWSSNMLHGCLGVQPPRAAVIVHGEPDTPETRRLAHWIRPLQQPWGVAAKRPHAERTENQRHFRLTPKTVITRRGAIPRSPGSPGFRHDL